MVSLEETILLKILGDSLFTWVNLSTVFKIQFFSSLFLQIGIDNLRQVNFLSDLSLSSFPPK